MGLNYKSVLNIDEEDASAAATGTAVPAELVQRASIIAEIAGATGPTGTLALEASNAPAAAASDPAEPSSTSWATVDTASVTDNGTAGVSVTGLAYRWLRATWTPTAGTGGTITVHMQCVGDG